MGPLLLSYVLGTMPTQGGAVDTVCCPTIPYTGETRSPAVDGPITVAREEVGIQGKSERPLKQAPLCIPG